MPLNAKKISDEAAKLRRRAEARLRETRAGKPPAAPLTEIDSQRLLHELQVHQIQLEMQNEELREARVRLEESLEKFTDLYDFSPVGYFSLDEGGRILEVNLTGAALLGIERSLLLKKSFLSFVKRDDQATFLATFEKVFRNPGKHAAELALGTKAGATVWVDFQATFAAAAEGEGGFCRVAVSDITSFKRAKEAQTRMETLVSSNERLQVEVVRRKESEKSLKRSRNELVQSLREAKRMEVQLRRLSHRILQAQEDERKRISVELHDEVSQLLAGISIRLTQLRNEAGSQDPRFKRSLAKTQKMVEKSVGSVHRFAMKLRPTILDDLGLIPALHTSIDEFAERNKIPVDFQSFAALEELGSNRRTVLFRVVQSALSNIARHAGASRVRIRIEGRSGGVFMEIHDDGKAFDVDQVLQITKHKRMGLIGMRERVEMIGGRFKVQSLPGEGTTICVHIPRTRKRITAQRKQNDKRL
ncbi:MAG: PAS domain S-box protein [Opitutales bacterium]|nr:PAS domain S-box protein [Opitutales bacterium]